MRCVSITPGKLEPVLMHEVKTFLRITTGDIEDATLATMISAARTACETFARICISPREWAAQFVLPQVRGNELVSDFVLHDPDKVSSIIRLPRRPITGVTEVKLLSRSSVVIDVPAYIVDEVTKDIIWQETFKGARDSDAYALQIKYTAGFPPNHTDLARATKVEAGEEISMAVMETVSHFYENRGKDVKVSIPYRAMELLRGHWTSRTFQ